MAFWLGTELYGLLTLSSCCSRRRAIVLSIILLGLFAAAYTSAALYRVDTTFSYTWSSSTESFIKAAAPLTTEAMVAAGGDIGYECTVKNTGSVAGDAVVLGFVNSTDPQFPREKLFDFERVSLQPGESKTVLLTVTSDALSVVEEDGRRWLRSAGFTVAAGDREAPVTHAVDLLGLDQLLDDTSLLY